MEALQKETSDRGSFLIADKQIDFDSFVTHYKLFRPEAYLWSGECYLAYPKANLLGVVSNTYEEVAEFKSELATFTGSSKIVFVKNFADTPPTKKRYSAIVRDVDADKAVKAYLFNHKKLSVACIRLAEVSTVVRNFSGPRRLWDPIVDLKLKLIADINTVKYLHIGHWAYFRSLPKSSSSFYDIRRLVIRKESDRDMYLRELYDRLRDVRKIERTLWE